MKRLNEKEIRQMLQKAEILPFRIDVRGMELYTRIGDAPGAGYRPDLLVDINWGNKTFRFLAEIKPVATPKLISTAISQVDLYLSYFNEAEPGNPYYPMIVTPYLNEKQLEELAGREISAIDLSGNVVLIIPEEIFVLKTGNPNRFPSSGPIKNVYRGMSSIVARVMLAKPEYESVNEIFEEQRTRGGEISLGTVSKVLKSLEEDFIVARNSEIKLIDPKLLLDKLRKNYQEPKIAERIVGKVANVQETLVKINDNCKQSFLRYAIDEPRKYTVFPTVGTPTKIYTEDIRMTLSEIEIERTERFADLELIETPDQWVYFDRKWAPEEKVYYTSPLQVYLGLSRGGKREQEVAAKLGDSILAGDMVA